MVEEKKEIKKREEYVLVEVPTGSALAFKSPEGEVLTVEQLLVSIANDLRDIKRAF